MANAKSCSTGSAIDVNAPALRRTQLVARQPVFLRSYVFACPTRDGAIFLDLKRDRYFGLGAPEASSLADAIVGWPRVDLGDVRSGSDERAARVCATLQQYELVTGDETEGRPAGRSPIESGSELIELPPHENKPIAVSEICNFLIACLGAFWLLRCRSLHAAVTRVAALRKHRSAAIPCEHRRAAELAYAFRRLRVYFFAKRNRCLYHALALVLFMARYRVHASWVIGVRTSPFAAHSWVQHGRIVFDATPEEVSFYQPILSV